MSTCSISPSPATHISLSTSHTIYSPSQTLIEKIWLWYSSTRSISPSRLTNSGTASSPNCMSLVGSSIPSCWLQTTSSGCPSATPTVSRLLISSSVDPANPHTSSSIWISRCLSTRLFDLSTTPSDTLCSTLVLFLLTSASIWLMSSLWFHWFLSGSG